MESSSTAAAVDDGKPFATEVEKEVHSSTESEKEVHSSTENEKETQGENGTAKAAGKKRSGKRKNRDHSSNEDGDVPQYDEVIEISKKKTYDRIEKTYDSEDEDGDEDGTEMYEEVYTQKFVCRAVKKLVPKPVPEQPVKKVKRSHPTSSPKKKDAVTSIASDYADAATAKKADEATTAAVEPATVAPVA